MKYDYDEAWRKWEAMIRYSPAPFHRRRMSEHLAASLDFVSVLDVGCGNAETLLSLRRKLPHLQLAGVDISRDVIERNRARYPEIDFFHVDIGVEPLGDQRFDLILCQEVLEHVEDWRLALRHLRAACKGHIIITVPAGKLFSIDRMVGHLRHYTAPELESALRDAGFHPVHVWQWGFPFHTLYKSLINVFPKRTMSHFADGEYGVTQKLLARAVTGLFYLNLRNSRFGRQLIALAGVQ